MESFKNQYILNLPFNRSSTWFDAVNVDFFFKQNQVKNVQSIGKRIFEDNTHMQDNFLHGDEQYNQLNNDLKVSNYSVYYENNTIKSYAPCQGHRPWNFAQCYGFYGQPACPLIKIIDMEDFMNNEKRKEKSRDAARFRRSRETEIFTELGETLPVRKDELYNLDKASVMRLAIATLKIEDMKKLFKIKSDHENLTQNVENFDENAVMKALDGFFIAISASGDVTYVSENIHEYIGIQQIDMIGNPIWDYAHQCDHIELRDILNIRHLEALGPDRISYDPEKITRNALIRIKCTLTSRGRNVNIKSASYKVINIVGYSVADEKQRHQQFIGIARLVPHPSNIEIPLDSKTFLSKHSLNMKFSYVDDKMLPILGYKPNDLLEKSLYEYQHGADSIRLMNSFKNAINKGQTETPQYRFLGRNGGFCWVVSQATLIYDKQKPQSVVCINYVISGLVNENEIYSLRQLEAFNTLTQNNTKKIQEKQIEIKSENTQIGSNSDNYQNPHYLDIDKNNSLNTTNKIENIKSSKSDTTIRRVFLANHLNITPIKGNPKAVTASVFKTLPTFKHKLNVSKNINAQRTNKPFMKTESLYVIESFGEVHSKISEPSILPRQTVVTASLFQPRREKPETAFSNPSTDLFFTETMNRTFRRTDDEKCQTISLKPNKDVEQIRIAAPSAFSSDSVTSQKSILSSNFGMLSKPLSVNTSNDNPLLLLGETTPLFGEIFNELILPDGYCTLLPEEIQSIDEPAGKINIEDDFVNYAENKNVSPTKSNNVLIPSNTLKGSECSSLPSLGSPNSFSRNEEFTFMSTSLDNDDIDLSMRAPYIPMNENDDLPLLTEDLMWSAFSDEVSLRKDINTNNEFLSQPSQPQPVTPEKMDQILINDVQKTLSSNDSRFLSPTMNSCISTKYSDNKGPVTNKPIEKPLKIVQNENSTKHTGYGDMKMINNVITIDSGYMILKEPIAECALESTAIIHTKSDDHSSENEKVQPYSIQRDDFIKNCADNPLLQLTMNNPTEKDVTLTRKKSLDPSKHIFLSEIQSKQSEPNVMNNNHKRCSPLEKGVIKRLRSHANLNYYDLTEIENIQEIDSIQRVSQHSKEFQNSHLLRQLMAPTPQRNEKVARLKSKDFGEVNGVMKESTQWNHGAGLGRSEDQSSDSVLKNLLFNDMTSVKKTPVGEIFNSNMMQQIQTCPQNVEIENEVKCIDNDSINMYELIEDVFLIDELNLNSADSIKENPSTFFIDDSMRAALKSSISNKRHSESVEKQITISVPQPPPLKPDAFTIGGGLFQGITDNINILPTSLISPMEKSDFNGYDSIKPEKNNNMDIWNSELE